MKQFLNQIHLVPTSNLIPESAYQYSYILLKNQPKFADFFGKNFKFAENKTTFLILEPTFEEFSVFSAKTVSGARKVLQNLNKSKKKIMEEFDQNMSELLEKKEGWVSKCLRSMCCFRNGAILILILLCFWLSSKFIVLNLAAKLVVESIVIIGSFVLSQGHH